MATDMYRKFLNTRQRITSTFVNRMTSLAARNLQEALRYALGGDVSRGGVIAGLTCSINGGTMTVTVAAGLGLLVDAAMVHPDSQYRWCELTAGTSVNIPAADPANPRWDVIEIAPGNTTIGAALVDEWNPATGTFSSVSRDDEYQPTPTLSVRSGTAAASPLFPAGIAGRIPLAYVYVPAAAVTLTANDLVHCRPMLKAPGSLDTARASKRSVQGGGVAVAADGTTLALRGCTGYMPSSHAPFGVGVVGSSTSLAMVASSFSGGSLPGTDAAVALFAVRPPYPTGYDTTLAPREFRPEANATTRFPSLVSAQLSGCIVVASTTHTPNAGTEEGAPTAGGNFSIQAAPWGTGGSPALVAPEDSIYLGSAFYAQGAAVFRAQAERSGFVYPTASKPFIEMDAGASFIATPATVSGRGIIGTDAFVFPTTAFEVKANLRIAALGTLTSLTYEFRDELRNNSPSGNVIREETARYNATAVGNVEANQPYELVLDASGQFTIQSVSASPGAGDMTNLTLVFLGYRDAILARR